MKSSSATRPASKWPTSYDDRLYNAARNLVDRIEVVDPERTSDISQPWLKQALLWSIGGLGFSADDVKGLLEDA